MTTVAPARLRPAARHGGEGGNRARVADTDHACLWCGAYDCPDRWEHDRLWGGSEQRWRLTAAEAKACTACRQPSDNGRPCPARTLLAADNRAGVSA